MRPVVLQEEAVEHEVWDDPTKGALSFRTLFSREATGTDTLTTGVADLGPGEWLGRHRHDPTEVYYVIEGRGVVMLDGIEHPVGAGSSVFIPGGTEHGIRNLDAAAALRFLYVFAMDSFEDIEYRFS
jgi:mannose-6-phosphate isomerase-like protein (cupin superfamily)